MNHRSHLMILSLLLVGVVVSVCRPAPQEGSGPTVPSSAPSQNERLATFAGGCFWCMEKPFEGLGGVRSVISGYAGGTVANPSYEQVSSGTTGHVEAVQITFDPQKTSYDELLEVYWRSLDPTDAGGQFADRGSQYRPVIFAHDAEQRAAAERSKAALDLSGRFTRPIAVEIVDYSSFYPAEEYHQDYYRKNPARYERYHQGSGREGFLRRVWGDEPMPKSARYQKPSEADLRRRLTDLQYRVTQESATERAFQNEFWNNKHAGVYVDVASGEPLFSSVDKYDSGTGWPSFVRPLVPDNVVEVEDNGFWSRRVEVRSKHGDSHLGHVFEDGPKPTGRRYCINSAALRFVPVEKLKDEGYGEFAPSFEVPSDGSR